MNLHNINQLFNSLLWTTIILLFNLSSSLSFHNISNLEYGFLFEKLNNIQLQSSSWIFISHINLTEHINEIKYAAELINITETQCDILRNQRDEMELCDNILIGLNNELNEIRQNSEYIISNKPNKRKKRGLLNIVGHTFKLLFGTLDTTDAERYTAAIGKINHNVNTHTTILRSALSQLNATNSRVNKHTEMINQLSTEVNMLSRSFQKNYIYSRAHYLFEELSNLISSTLKKIERDQTKIFDIIFSAKYGLLHDSLFDPNAMYEEMLSAQISSHGQHFPYTLVKSNIFKILQLSTFNAIQNNNIILFEIKTPLVQEEKFILYNVISIPKPTEGNRFVYIEPDLKKFIINSKQDVYAPFYEPETHNRCKLIEPQHYICDSQSPMYLAGKKSSCVIQMFSSSTLDTTLCKEKTYEIRDEFWIWLREPNTYIYILSTPTSISLNCDDNDHQILQLTNVGMIHTNCNIKSHNILITPTKIHQSKTMHNSIRSITPVHFKNSSTHQDNTLIINSMEPMSPLSSVNMDAFETLITSNDTIEISLFIFLIVIIPLAIAVIFLCIFAVWLYVRGVRHRSKNQQEAKTTP